MPFELTDRNQLTQDAIRRVVAATRGLSYFGSNSAVAALVQAIAGAASVGEAHLEEGYRRSFVKPSSGAFLDALLEEAGRARQTSLRAALYVVFVPEVSNVTAIAGVGPYVLTISGYVGWQAGDSLRIKGSATEVATVISSTSTSVTVALGGAAGFVTDLGNNVAVKLLARATVPADTTIQCQGGVQVQTTASLVTGDANPLLAGEGTDLSLVDKVWCEATVGGVRGNVQSVTSLSTPIRGVRRVFNPVPATGGADTQDDFEAKYTLAHASQATSQGTLEGSTALARTGNARVLRTALLTSNQLSTIKLSVLTTSLGLLTANETLDLQQYMAMMSIPNVAFQITGMTLTAVQIAYSVTLTPGATGETAAARRDRLRALWARMASAFAAYIDLRSWALGGTVPRSNLLAIALQDSDVSGVDTTGFLPAADVSIASTALPYLASLVITDTSTGFSVGDSLSQVY